MGLEELRIRGRVWNMSRTLHEAGLAITLDGTVLVSAAQFFRNSKNPQELLRLALTEEGDLFIGIAMNELETDDTLVRLDNAAAEAAAYVVGARQKGRPARKKPR
jgi:hypothetical protein